MSSKNHKKPRRPSSSLYGRAPEASRMDLISEKDEEIGFDLTRNTADGVSGETRLSNVPGLSNKVRISFGERCIWLSATILLGFLCVGLGVQLGKAMERSPAYKETDLVSVRSAIVEEKRPFHTTAKTLENGTSTFSTEGLKYVGPPSQEIDDAWKELMQPQILALSDEEAGEMKDLSIKNDFGKRIMSLYMYHTLHCVNMVRKSLDFEYYYENHTEKMGDDYRGHVYHCLDDIRQNIMCQGDLTPVPFYWDDIMRWPVGNTSQPHTCRNLDSIREWAMARRVGKGASPIGLPVENAEHVHR
ncbi:hypothetical protein NLU13_0515 [Sarocladium strictum]|uniref:Uncharacterized protein n=1 Tax=Sarocladium strictum TaxID=5046 RepID=A0AA39GP73_SARSR|nr:hypothetical protein NLU13_0515 [Sarocladium strictum]